VKLADTKTVNKTFKKEQAMIQMTKGDETILLVDDEAFVIDANKLLLERLGYRVLTAQSGHEAIEIYQSPSEKVHMVILDMIMPEMNGGETYDRLRAIDPKVKVILSSGYGIDGTAQDILDRGCNGFIQKPFKISHLSQKLRQILDE
jgi:two-component system cell cycle sensor histidine kinase/response regulator CckA